MTEEVKEMHSEDLKKGDSLICLFCDTKCSKTLNDEAWRSSFWSKRGKNNDTSIGAHLLSIFVLRQVLQLEEQKCCKLLRQSGGGGGVEVMEGPGQWFSLCASCNGKIREFYEALVKVRRLEKRMTAIRVELRSRIDRSRRSGFEGGDKEHKSKRRRIHLEIRQCVTSDEAEKHDTCNEMDDNLNADPEKKYDNFAIGSPGPSPASSPIDSDVEGEKVVTQDRNRCQIETNIVLASGTRPWPTGRKPPADETSIPYYCDHCPLIYCGEKSFLKHCRQWHSSRDLVACPNCESKFESKQLLQLHCEREHPGTSNPQPLNTARSEDSGSSQPSICSYCSIQFPSQLRLDYHTARYHFKKAFLVCKVCDFQAGSYDNLQQHLATHSNDVKNQACEICSLRFYTKHGLYNHRRVHHSEELGGLQVLTCEQCGLKVPTLTSLQKHVKQVHEAGRDHVCEICGKTFKTEDILRYHTRKHTTPKDVLKKKGPFTCEHCPAQFIKRAGLYSHMKRSHGEKYRCQLCGLRFDSSSALNQHKSQCLPTTSRLNPAEDMTTKLPTSDYLVL